MSIAPAVPAKIGRYRWAICALLFFVITINYIDRQVIGVLKPVIEQDMGWSEVDYGNIVTAFQASYGFGLLVVGRWLDRVGTRRGMAIAIGLWSLAACFHAAARTVLGFILARMALGLAESAAYPGTVKSVAEWFPRRERALGVGILNAGANVGVLSRPWSASWSPGSMAGARPLSSPVCSASSCSAPGCGCSAFPASIRS